MPGYHINSEACRRQGFHFRQVYAALRFSRDKNKAGILDVYWDCGFLGVKDGSIAYWGVEETEKYRVRRDGSIEKDKKIMR